ncbi:hypothetical protein IAR50_005137 [Cryptococcus sp. DSM 104548]
MRFSSIFVAALPILSSVFAAPLYTEGKKDLAFASHLVERDGILLNVLANLKADIADAGSLHGITVQANITPRLQKVLDALNEAGSALGIDLSLGVNAKVGVDVDILKREIEERAVNKLAVGAALVDILSLINVNILAPVKSLLSASSSSYTETSSLIAELDTLLSSLVTALGGVVSGLLNVVVGLLKPLLPLISGLLGSLLPGLLGTLGLGV